MLRKPQLPDARLYPALNDLVPVDVEKFLHLVVAQKSLMEGCLNIVPGSSFVGVSWRAVNRCHGTKCEYPGPELSHHLFGADEISRAFVDDIGGYPHQKFR